MFRLNYRLFEPLHAPACASALCALALAAAETLTASPAHAHGAYPVASQIVFDRDDADRYTVNTSIGLMRTENAGASWSWICRSAYGAEGEEPTLALLDWNTLLVGHQQGLSVSHDGGCSFRVVESFAGKAVQQIEAAAGGGRLFAITGSWDAANGVYVSEDRGDSWRLSGDLHDMRLTKLLVSAQAPEHVYVAAIEVTETGAEIPETVIYRSTDGGSAWETVPFPLAPGETGFLLLGLDPTRATTLYASTVSNGAVRLLKSDDGARTWRELNADSRGFALLTTSPDGQKVFLGSGQTGLSRSFDGGETFSPPTVLNVHCLAARDQELWFCPDYISTSYEVGRSTDDGLSFEPVLALEDFRHGRLSVVQCAGDTLAQQCEEARAEVEVVFDQFDVIRGSAGASADEPRESRSSASRCTVSFNSHSGGDRLAALGLIALMCLTLRARWMARPRHTR